MERKEWKTLYLINKPTCFLGFRPVQWVGLCCMLFITGWFAWWLALALVFPIYLLGKRISRLQSAGHPNPIVSYVIWFSMQKYFIDEEGFFDKLNR